MENELGRLEKIAKSKKLLSDNSGYRVGESGYLFIL